MDFTLKVEAVLEQQHEVANISDTAITPDSLPSSTKPTSLKSPWEVAAENPCNWPAWRKFMILFVCGLAVLNTTIASSLPSMAMSDIAREFKIDSALQKQLPISVFLIGYIFGPVVSGPLSEHVGRRRLLLLFLSINILFTLGCALAPTWWSFLLFRLLAGTGGSAPLGVVPGTLADIFAEPHIRGLSFSILSITVILGACLGPVVSGLTVAKLGWRWAFWVGLIMAVVTSLLLYVFLRETRANVLLSRLYPQFRRSSTVSMTGNTSKDKRPPVIKAVLARPFRMLIFEPVVTASCIHLALSYAIFYVSFSVIPFIFLSVYKLPPSITGLCFLPIAIGSCLSLPIIWYWDGIVARGRTQGHAWTSRDEYLRMPPVALGGLLFTISVFWLGFTARPDIPFSVPLLAGLPFGVGFALIYGELANYLTDAYHVFAASAHAASTMTRSTLAVLLPLATPSLFARLGISGTCALLGGLSGLMTFVPFLFIYFGPTLRARSPFAIILGRSERRASVADEGLFSGEDLMEAKSPCHTKGAVV
ncbi:hypothetical protein GQ602_005803 [Ophiocordyceps camponoti-floridani]|uniref:Major facilitator superfamily (MFS) profile domain-containing protein n=1 Tax=Ophiocordyceps camponoti-floridani TaxID=2030778 RepID=A0A8H4Q414_9HYPO|nr:hypothetical protein GQ602_005803 [Ophiocordyceps camponoti-floridani]